MFVSRYYQMTLNSPRLVNPVTATRSSLILGLSIKQEIKSAIAKFVIHELPTIEANIRTDKVYGPILKESTKLLLGLHNKICGYRDQKGNAFYGSLQCFEGSYVLMELEKVFILIYEREFGLCVRVEDVVQEDSEEERDLVEDGEDKGVFVENVVSGIQKRKDNQAGKGEGKGKGAMSKQMKKVKKDEIENQGLMAS